MMRGKKGDVPTSLNWVFVAIVGVILLTFFAGFITKQQDLSEQKVTAKVLNDIDLITVGAQASKGTLQRIDLPQTEVTFSCVDCDCNFVVGDLQKPYGDKLIFSPEYLRGREGLAWSLDWSSPYRVTNLLYFTSPQARYVFFYPDGESSSDIVSRNLAFDLEDTIPEEINAEFIAYNSLQPLEDLNNYKVRIVYVGIEPQSSDLVNFEDMEDDDVSALVVSPGASLAQGTIQFYQKQFSSWRSTHAIPTYYLGEESLLGAVFSEDSFTYRCNMQKAFKRLATTSDVYLERANVLVTSYSQLATEQAQCAVPIADARTYITRIGDSAQQLGTVFAVEETNSLSAVSAISSASNPLRSRNDEAGFFQCASIY